MNPPERAIVFSFDEKTQVQALDRTQPSLPMKKGRGATMTQRLQASRHDGPVRRDERGDRRSPQRHEETSFIQGGARLLLMDRFTRVGRPCYPRRARQSLRAQICVRHEVVGEPQASAVASSLQADELLLAQPRRRLIRTDHQSAHQEGCVQLSAASRRRDRHLGGRVERGSQALRLEETR